MPNIQDRNRPDYLQAWHQSRDPLRTRHGLTAAEYGWAGTRLARARRRIPDRVLDIAAAVIVGATLGILLAWRG